MTACSNLTTVQAACLGLDSARLLQFAFEDRPPLLVAARRPLASEAGDGGQLAGRFGQLPISRAGSEKRLGPTRGLVSHFSASRSAIAKVRRMPRVR